MRDILFMGKILALVTHDMQNVMAIIKESGALANDILQMNGPPRMRHGDKLEVALANIQEQVARGRDMMLMLNGFAHAAEDFPDHADLARFARQICVPAQRLARLKECSFDLALDSPPLPVRGNGLALMQSIHSGLVAVLNTCQSGDIIRVGTTRSEEGTLLRISAKASKATPDQAETATLMHELGGDCRSGEGFLELRYVPASAQGTVKP